MTDSTRKAEHAVNPIFIDRWSPRAFTGEAISESELLTIIEAGRWAPSAYNVQPWRFIYARSGTPAWETLFSTLNPFNQSWAKRASALIVVVSANNTVAGGESKPNLSHEFDTGAAWGFLALQTSLLGWHAHAMTGIDKELARASLGVPEGYTVEAAVAIGRRSDDKSFLAEALQSRESPSPRLPLKAIAAEGKFTFEA